MTAAPRSALDRVPFFVWAAVPMLAGAWLRGRGLGRLEPFVDEGANILTALDPRVHAAFEPLAQGRPWLAWLFAPAGWFPENILLAARAEAALAGMATLLLLGWTAHRLAGKAAAWLATMLWAVLPLAVWHERLALQDPFVTALLAGTLGSLVAAHGSSPRVSRGWLIAAGLLAGAAFLQKISAAFAVVWLVPAWLVLRRQGGRPWLSADLGWLALGVTLPLLSLGSRLFELGSKLGRYQALPGWENGAASSAGERLARWIGWYAGYGGWALALLLVGAAYFAWAQRQRIALALGAGWILTLLAGGLLYNHGYARYAMPDHVPLILAVAVAFGAASGLESNRRWIGAATGVAVLTWGWVGVAIGTDPRHAPVPAADVAQYVSGPWSGRGISTVERFLSDHADRTGARCLVLVHRYLRPGCYGLLLAERADPRLGVVPYTVYDAEELAAARQGLEHAAAQAGGKVDFFLLYEGSLYPPPPWLEAPGSPADRVLSVGRGEGEAFTLFRLKPRKM